MSSAEPRHPRFFNLSSKSSRQVAYALLFTLLLALVLFAHTFQLDRIPTGLFFDESSIGYNAMTVWQNGVDEHDVRFPIYFESVGDYKNPIYIYAVVPVFAIFGISEYTLRFTSVLFYAASLLLTFLLATKLFHGNKTIQLYLLASFGFLPLFFTISRIAFEVISQLAWVSAVGLCIWMVFHEEGNRRLENFKPLLCGVVLGTFTYTYSTSRLISTVALGVLWLVYFERKNIRKLFLISTAFIVCLNPLAWFTLKFPGAITSRFRGLSYIDAPISLAEKMEIFAHNLATYFSLDFLILHGDDNLRHSTGQGGVIYIVTLILFLIGLAYFLINNKFDRFNVFLLSNLIISPLAAALTSEGTPHALRGMLLGYYILLISCYGLKYLLEFSHSRVRAFSIACVSILLLYEVTNYQVDYFFRYPARSVDAMGSYDLKGSLDFAIGENPKEIILFNNFAGGLYNFQFYELVVTNPNQIPMLAAPAVAPMPGACIIYHRLSGAEEELDKYPLEYTEFRSRTRPSELEKQFGAEPFSGVIKARCYQDIQ